MEGSYAFKFGGSGLHALLAVDLVDDELYLPYNGLRLTELDGLLEG